MGRAPNLQAYVKQGADQAETEIELKASRGKRNYVILRRFQKGNEKSVWLLNGKTTTKRDIDALVARLGVQANNLWCVCTLIHDLTPVPSFRRTRLPSLPR